MSLTQDHLDAALAEVRVSPELRRRVMHGLRDRPHSAIRPLRALAACALALLVILFTIFAAPPIVRAAGAWIERVFGGMVSRIEQKQALPDAKKIAQEVALREREARTLDIEASAEFGGVTVSVSGINLHPKTFDQPERAEGRAFVSIRLSGLPAFDPNWIDFALAYDGQSYAMQKDGSLKEYRKMGRRRDLTEADWFADKTGNLGIYSVIEGRPTGYARFAMPNWRIERKTEMLLTGTLDGESFSIPFVFDPEVAHDQLVRGAAEGLAYREDLDEQDKLRLSALAEASGPVGLSMRANGYELTIGDLALEGNNLHIGWTVRSLKNPIREADEDGFYIHSASIDGYPSNWSGGVSEQRFEDGVLCILDTRPVVRDMRRLPDESLIVLNLVLNDMDERVGVAFRYNWNARRATLPQDEAQRQQWLDEDEALVTRLFADEGGSMFAGYDLSAQNLSQAIGGLTMTLKRAEMTGTRMELVYAFDASAMDPRWRLGVGDGELSIDGLRALPDGGGYMFDQPAISHFVPPISPSEIEAGMHCAFELSVQMYDRSDEEVYSNTFGFEFTLDDAAREAGSENPAMRDLRR